jgi:hypothetical protein
MLECPPISLPYRPWQPLRKSNILTDWQVVNFVTKFQYARSRLFCPRGEKKKIIEVAIRDRQAIEIVYMKMKNNPIILKTFTVDDQLGS